MQGSVQDVIIKSGHISGYVSRSYMSCDKEGLFLCVPTMVSVYMCEWDVRNLNASQDFTGCFYRNLASCPGLYKYYTISPRKIGYFWRYKDAFLHIFYI